MQGPATFFNPVWARDFVTMSARGRRLTRCAAGGNNVAMSASDLFYVAGKTALVTGGSRASA